MITLRNATPADAEALVAIYSHYVSTTAISFEIEPPTVENFRERIINTTKKFPYLVAVNEAGVPVGYTYASTLRARPAFNHCVEVSIYINKECRGQGIAPMLYTELEQRLKAMGIINLYASIAWTDVENEYLTHQSPEFHEHMGYTKVGHWHKCGNKFGKWFDIIWMEKYI